jgi:hypothetical protein
MKGAIVPESKRAAIYNLYRIPLNFIVLFSLLTNLKPWHSFLLNFFMLSTATVLQVRLMKQREKIGLDRENPVESSKMGGNSDDVEPLLSDVPSITKEDEAV